MRWECPICGQNNQDGDRCSNCDFDRTLDLEKHCVITKLFEKTQRIFRENYTISLNNAQKENKIDVDNKEKTGGQIKKKSKWKNIVMVILLLICGNVIGMTIGGYLANNKNQSKRPPVLESDTEQSSVRKSIEETNSQETLVKKDLQQTILQETLSQEILSESDEILDSSKETEVFAQDSMFIVWKNEEFGKAVSELLGIAENQITQTDFEMLNSIEIGGDEFVWNKNDGSKRTVKTAEPLTVLDDLSYFTNLEHLTIHDVNLENVDILSNLLNLRYLDLWCDGITNVDGFSNLINLQVLWLKTNTLTDISGLRNLSNLMTVGLKADSLTDIQALGELTNLLSVTLNCESLVDISIVELLTNLQFLGVFSGKVTDIHALENLTNLKSLTLNCENLTDIRALSNLTNLEELSLSACSKLKDIQALSNLSNLKVLYLNACDIDDFSPIENIIPNLEIFEK